MKKKILISIATVLITMTGLNAQKIYELDEVNQVPYVDEDNMKTIAFTLVDLYKTAVKTPEKYSTDEATNNTVYLFYDTDWDGRFNKINPRNGEKYSADKKSDLEQNDRLLFNLTFDENGNLVIPEKVFVISYRETEVDRTIKQIGQIAFELILPDSTKTKLKNVKLKNTAAVDKNSMTGGLTPVKVLIPFDLSFGYGRSKETSGTVVKRGNFIDVSISRYFRDENERLQIIEFLKANSELMQYKKGTFQFVIEDKFYNYHIDINIGRDMVVSSQPKSFSVSSKHVKSFSGEGKKIK